MSAMITFNNTNKCQTFKQNSLDLSWEVYETGGGVVIASTKIFINLPWNYEMLHCKGESYRFSGLRDPLLQTKKAYYFI